MIKFLKLSVCAATLTMGAAAAHADLEQGRSQGALVLTP